MDILTFITRSIEGLAWPVCVLIVTLLFKVQIADLLSRVRKGKYPGGEFEFSEAAKEQIAVVTEAGIAAAGPSSSGENGTGRRFWRTVFSRHRLRTPGYITACGGYRRVAFALPSSARHAFPLRRITV